MEGVSPILTSEISVSTDVQSPAAERRTQNPSNSKNEDAAYVKVSGAPLSEKDTPQIYQKPQKRTAADKDEQRQSREAKSKDKKVPAEDVEGKEGSGAEESEETDKEKAQKAADEQKIRELKKRDAEVRAHEQAHLAALGAYKRGGASFTYETGPDGRQYAVGGEVQVDVSPEKTPEETIRKAQIIQRAALAPAEPSGADRSVAARAAQMAASAQQELAKQSQSESAKSSSKESGKTEAAKEEEDKQNGVDAVAQGKTEKSASVETTKPKEPEKPKGAAPEEAAAEPATAPASGSAELKSSYQLTAKQRESNVSRYENIQFPPPEKGMLIAASV